MPHQCTQCGHTFPDGSKQMLSGCPDCGGNKFQFKPADDDRTEDSDSSSAPRTADAPASPAPDSDLDTDSESESSEPASNAADTTPDSTTEDRAQADARREVAAHDEIEESPSSESATEPESGAEPKTGTESETDESTEKEDDSNMAALRRELNDQFESIKILEPGQYELNLMELYNREEYIVALQEDGQYVIEVPETWLGGDDE